MVGLYIITLGIYGIVWLARRRNEIVKHYKLPVPHWLWLILPSIAALLLLPPVGFIAYGATLSPEGFSALLIGFALLAALIAFGISIWWIWRFGQAVEKITEGKIPLGWTIAYWVLLGSVTLFMLQYHFNRSSDTINAQPKAKHKPSKKFVILSTIVMVLSVVFGVASIALIPYDDDWTTFQTEARRIDEKGEEADRLFDRHDECIKRLDKDYPGDLTAENEAAYNEDYAICERVRLKQKAAADEYNASVEDW